MEPLGKKNRFLGIHLGGAKSDSTALVVLDVFLDRSAGSREKRFLVDVIDHIQGDPNEGADQNLLGLIQENESGVISIGVDAPLTLPPCVSCQLDCPGVDACEVPTVVWLKSQLQKKLSQPRKGKRIKPIAPYMERPVDFFMRDQFSKLGFGKIAFQDAFGANNASKTARAHYLKKHLKNSKGKFFDLVEVNPTLALVMLQSSFCLSIDDLKNYKDLEKGASVRMGILDRINENQDVFLYEKDLSRLVVSMPAFYAFLCAYTAYLRWTDRIIAAPENFPKNAGWVAIPKSRTYELREGKWSQASN